MLPHNEPQGNPSYLNQINKTHKTVHVNQGCPFILEQEVICVSYRAERLKPYYQGSERSGAGGVEAWAVVVADW